MKPAPYTEDTLVQQTTAEYLKNELGWWSRVYFSSRISLFSMAKRISSAHGTNSHTTVTFSSEIASIIHPDSTPFMITAFAPTMKLPNQCILAPV